MRSFVVAISTLGLISVLACGGSSAPVQSQYQPQITNATDSFAFQLTGVTNGDGTLSYSWNNTGTAASIDRSSSITSGTVTLTLRDSTSALVYQGSLDGVSGSVATGTGVAGAWTIVVDFAQASGTINFRAQKQ